MTALGSLAAELIRPAPVFIGRKALAVEPERPPGKMKGPAYSQSESVSAFQARFRKDAVSAVSRLTQDVLLHRVDVEEAASLLLPYLVRSSYAQRNLVFNALMEFATPEALLFAALAVNERYHDPRLLRIAAELLEHYGSEALPVLTRLAQSGRPECRHFVGTIINLTGVSEEQKRQALTALAEHPDLATRQELLDEVDRASASDATMVCCLLAHDADRKIRTAAGERIAELEQ